MHEPLRVLAAAALLLAGLTARAQTAAEPPAFDVAYRAWSIVTDLSRQRREPAIAGECGRTFRPFVIPGLKPQSRQDQDAAARTCVAAARAACANPAFTRDAAVAQACGEFR